MAEEDSPSSSLLPSISTSATVDAAVTGLSLFSLTPSQRSRHSVRHSGKKPKHLFGVAVSLGEAYSTGLEGDVHQRR